MRQRTGASASIAAVVSSLASLACCLPLSFAAALGAAGAGAFWQSLRPYLLGLSVVFLGLGFWQQRRAKACGVKRSSLSAVLLWTAAAIVLGMILFPQQIAGFIADRLSSN